MRRVALGTIVPTAWLFLNPLVHLADDRATDTTQYVMDEMRTGILKTLGGAKGSGNTSLFVTAGTLLLVGATAAAVTVVGDWLFTAALRRISTRVEFDSRDDSFRWVMEWLVDNKYAQNHAGVYVCAANPSKVYGYAGAKGEQETSTPQLTPGEGSHWLTTAEGRWVVIVRKVRSGGGNTRQESLTCYMLGGRAKMDRFIAECATACREKDLKRTLVYSGGEHGSWNMAQARLRRPMQTVILEDKCKNLVLDAREFFDSEIWYAERGIPWRRGFLLYGAPGTGKSSFVMALAGELGMNIYCIALGSAGMTDESLQSLVVTVPKRAILLIEDIDAAFSTGLDDVVADAKQEQHARGGRKTKLSLSGLMNAIDGVISQQGCLLCLTTNNLQLLPERLIRSGRIDVRCEFGLATKNQVRGLFRLFYGQGRPEEEEFVAACPAGRFSCSDVQSYLTVNKSDPAVALAALRADLAK